MGTVDVSMTTDNLWSTEHLKRYDVNLPRYTSYPGAQCFSEEFTLEDYSRALTAIASSGSSVGLYIHIPFCNDICYYCACNKIVTRDRSRIRQYLDALKSEINLVSSFFPGSKAIESIHFGGGTPTILSEGELTELIFELSRNFSLPNSADRDFSIEIDPRTVEPDTLGLLRGLGFNRVSFGVQDFDERVQQAINRKQSVKKVADLVQATRTYGFKSFNFDLIYGLPHQSVQSIRQTLDTVCELRPDRIALYNYAHMPERFLSQRAIDRHDLPDANTKLAMLCESAGKLQEAGYQYIGMDHFVLRDDELEVAAREGRLQRNFQGYAIEDSDCTIGMGVSAISSLQYCYGQNYKSVEAYQEALAKGALPYEKGVRLSRDDMLRRQVIKQIACQLELYIVDLESAYNICFYDYFASVVPLLQQASADGLLEIDAEKIRVTERGRLVLRNVCALFDARIGDYAGRFSRAI